MKTAMLTKLAVAFSALAGVLFLPHVLPSQHVIVDVRYPDAGQNATSSQPIPPMPPVNATTANVTAPDVVPEPLSQPEPKFVTEIQKPKYEEWELVSDIEVSSTPVELTPWTGNGPPFINIYYRFPDGRAWDDTGMLHNGYIQLEGYDGYDLCSQSGIRFWKWEHTAVDATDATNRSLVYWSEPLPDDPNQLLGSGENCYTRLFAGSTWLVRACYEGDGEITPFWDEKKGNTTIRHFDFMDGCGAFYYTFPP